MLVPVLLCLCLCTGSSSATRIANNQIYQSLQDTFFCFRRLNATHEIGCQSDASGNTGVLHLVEDEERDIEWITQHSTVFPLIPVLPLNHFTAKTMRTFAATDRVSGVIVIKHLINQTDGPVPQSFSPESSCPNDALGMYRHHPELAHCQKQQWVPDNPVSGLLSMSLPFPVFYLTEETSIEKVLTCYNAFNRPAGDGVARPWPLCSAQLQSLMHAAVHTPKCMSRSESFTSSLDGARFCDPLSSHNVFTYLIPRGHRHVYHNRSVVLVVARLDSLSMFDEMSYGAESAVTGVVSLLSVARTLASVREAMERDEPKKHVVFAIFDGEAFDYIGSSATVYDMEKGIFPHVVNSKMHPASISLSAISHVIELNQLAEHASASGPSLFLHSDPLTSGKSNQVKEDLEKLLQIIANAGESKVKRADISHGLPPSSVQSFLRKDEQIVGLHVSNHENEFTNPYYNSLLDSVERLSADDYEKRFIDHIHTVSQIISRSLFKLVTGQDSALIPEKDLIRDALDCILVNKTCHLFQEVSPQRSGFSTQNTSTPLYVSVIGNSRRQQLVSLISLLMLYQTGESVANVTSADQCYAQKGDGKENMFEYSWLMGKNLTGECMRGSTFLTEAISPAFDPDQPDWSSNEYSSWTESIWTSPRLRIFLKPNPSMEWFAFLSGCAITFTSFLVVYFVEKHSKTLFKSEPPSRTSIDRNMSEVST